MARFELLEGLAEDEKRRVLAAATRRKLPATKRFPPGRPRRLVPHDRPWPRQDLDAVAEGLIHALAAQVRRLSAQLTEARFVDADERVAQQLLRLEAIYSEADGSPTEIPLSQDEIAQLAVTTWPTVNRFLKSLGDAVVLRRGRVTLVDTASVVSRH